MKVMRLASASYLYSSDKLRTDTTSNFFVPAVNWLRADSNGKFASYPNHWHFRAVSSKKQTCRFLTIIHTHGLSNEAYVPLQLKDGKIKIGKWVISAELSDSGKPFFEVHSADGCTVLEYRGEETMVMDGDKQIYLKDVFPDLEI